MELREFQEIMERTYGGRDRARGTAGTFLWLVEEIGELAEALRKNETAALKEEFADCLAWLVSLANVAGIDMEEAVAKYNAGCPSCRSMPCRCPPQGKP